MSDETHEVHRHEAPTSFIRKYIFSLTIKSATSSTSSLPSSQYWKG